MNVWAWILLGFFVLEIIGTPLLVGKPREPISPRRAMANSSLWLFYVALFLLAVLS